MFCTPNLGGNREVAQAFINRFMAAAKLQNAQVTCQPGLIRQSLQYVLMFCRRNLGHTAITTNGMGNDTGLHF